MIVLVSDICHGNIFIVFHNGIYIRTGENNVNKLKKWPVLQAQAIAEKKNPVLPKINEFIKGKELIVTETAVKRFKEILNTVGGPNEKKRGKELLSKVKIVKDEPSQRALQLKDKNITNQHKIIFGTGDHYKGLY